MMYSFESLNLFQHCSVVAQSAINPLIIHLHSQFKYCHQFAFISVFHFCALLLYFTFSLGCTDTRGTYQLVFNQYSDPRRSHALTSFPVQRQGAWNAAEVHAVSRLFLYTTLTIRCSVFCQLYSQSREAFVFRFILNKSILLNYYTMGVLSLPMRTQP